LNNTGSIEEQLGEHGVGSLPGGEDSSDALTGASLKSGNGDVAAWGNSSSAQSNSHHHGRGSMGRGGMGRGGYNNGGSYRGRGYGGPGRGYRGNNYRSGPGPTGGGTREGTHTGYVRLRGLPFQASKQDILDFFQEYNPIESSVLLTYRGDGRSTGEGYVAFKDADDAKEAMALHRSTIGSRYIELFISNKEEHARNVARSNPR
jgi:heterogeneous nuclear ribonucleoprotein F/H